MSSVLLTCLLLVLCVVSHAADWSYEGEQGGYAKWEGKFPMCGGKLQSPINIISRDSEYDSALPALRFFTGRRQHTTTTVTNNGHSVTFSNLEKAYFVKLSGTYYKFDNLHFHWSSNSNEGSEHQIDSHTYSEELHMVHYNTKYHSIEEAASKSDGLAVIAVFLQEDSHVRDNSVFSCLRHAIQTVKMPGSKVVRCRRFQLQPHRLTPTSKDYFSYKGSLTTPPCTQNVEWKVFKEAVLVSRHFMKSLRSLLDLEGQSIAPNSRPIQPLNDRHVLRSFQLPTPVRAPQLAPVRVPKLDSAPHKPSHVADPVRVRPHARKYVKPCSG